MRSAMRHCERAFVDVDIGVIVVDDVDLNGDVNLVPIVDGRVDEQPMDPDVRYRRDHHGQRSFGKPVVAVDVGSSPSPSRSTTTTTTTTTMPKGIKQSSALVL